MIPTYFFLIVIGLAIWSRNNVDRSLKCIVVLWLFNGCAAAVLPPIGNANLSPTLLYMPFFAFTVIRGDRHALRKAMQAANPAGAVLVAFVIWACFSAVLMPRLLEGSVYVMSIDKSSLFNATVLIPVRATGTNLNQSVYLLADCVFFLMFCHAIGLTTTRQVFAEAVISLTKWNCVAAILGLIEGYAGITGPVTVIRNTTGYSVIGPTYVNGLMRITGVFSEASAFSGYTLPLFAFCSHLWHRNYKPEQTRFWAITSFALLILSTSSSAYAALIVYFATVTLGLVSSNLKMQRTAKLGLVSVLLWGSAVSACLLILVKPEWLDVIYRHIQITLLSKGDTASGVERGSWNSAAWDNVIDTYGLGVGLGSARTSSFILALLANLGILGTLLFTWFFSIIALRKPADISNEEIPVRDAALRAAYICMVGASISGTSCDLGFVFYGFAAVACANNLRNLLQPAKPRRYTSLSHTQSTSQST